MIRVSEGKASHCACRDCRGVVLGPIGTLCDDCRDAACDVFYELCRRPGAYAPRPKASCACCAGASRTGRAPRGLCSDCDAAGCSWAFGECIRTDLGDEPEPYEGQTPEQVAAAADDRVCLGCGGQVDAAGDDLCGSCARSSTLPSLDDRPLVTGAGLRAHVVDLIAGYRGKHSRNPSARWVLARLDEQLTSAGRAYDEAEARELAESNV